jgi:hypothetical protein
MKIRINLEELEFPWSMDHWRINKLYNVGIDYATQTLDAVDLHDDQYVTILYFEKYGIKLDNRFNTYELISDDEGFLIEIYPKKI